MKLPTRIFLIILFVISAATILFLRQLGIISELVSNLVIMALLVSSTGAGIYASSARRNKM